LNSLYFGADGMLDFLMPNKPAHIVIACMPKSASTFIATALSELPGFKRYRLIPDWGVREQQLSSTRLSRYNRRQYVAQHHLRNSYWTQQLIKQYRLTPVVLVRDFADCVVSLKDHNLRWPEIVRFFDKSQREMPTEDFEEAIVRLALPWYFDFYVGWRNAGNVPIYDFDDYTTDPIKIMREIIAQTNINYDDETLKQALSKTAEKFTRFNVGKSGRGRNLSKGAKDALMRTMELYPTMKDDPLFVKTAQTLAMPPERD